MQKESPLLANKQRPKGLGRGLDVLLGTDPAPAAESELRHLALNKLQAGRYQPRTRMDEQALQELADSIIQHGIMQPIVVRPLTSASDESRARFEIIAGERRYRAARAGARLLRDCRAARRSQRRFPDRPRVASDPRRSDRRAGRRDHRRIRVEEDQRDRDGDLVAGL